MSCSQCGCKLGGMMGFDSPSKEDLDFCRQSGVDVPEPICVTCFRPFDEKIKEASEKKENDIINMYVATLPAIDGKKCLSIGLVSAHIALGTGLISQLFAEVTDFLGKKSKTYNKKMREAEDACLYNLKGKAVEMGADAILGIQTTYTELTAGKGMLLVCMTGTAVKIDEN